MRHALAAVLSLLILVPAASAEPLRREEVPAPLKDWIGWVLRGHEAELCTARQGSGLTACAWPGPLRLTLTEGGGSFEESWRVEAEEWLPLPGGPERWPVEVKVDGAAVPVVDRPGQGPSVRVKPGARRVGGSFRWDRLPDQLEIPGAVGLLALTVRGAAVPFPLRDDANRLWLQSRARPAAPKENAGLALTVHRRLIDEVPLTLVTRVQLKVSGADRELVLGRALPEGFSPLSLVSALPARLDADGRLRVQARSGTWDVMLTARREAASADIRLPAPMGPWAADEAWVFDARPSLRQADVEGAPSLDPSQTELYPDWKSLPAYLVKPGGALKLVERRRGDDPPEPDRLTLERALWLDFDGRGFSARDRLHGRLGRSWRLESSPETLLGRVSAGGADQFLTTLASGAPAGLEVRSRDVDIVADSRVEGRGLTATGWKHDFESAAVTLHLPPGWSLFHAFGADSARPTWVSSWTLLDFFLVLVAAAAFLRLYGKAWGATGLVGLALLWHEPGAPRWLWLAALLFAALDRALPADLPAARWAKRARLAALAVLAVTALPFFLTQIRRGAFPVLEYPYQSVQPRATESDQVELTEPPSAVSRGAAPSRRSPRRQLEQLARAKQEMVAGAAAELDEAEPESDSDEGDDKADMPMSAPSPAPMSKGGGMYGAVRGGVEVKAKMRAPSYFSDVMTQMRLDPNARVNTGPGLPYWSWNTARLSWRGPVPQGHALRLCLLSPRMNFALALARVLLTCLLGLLLAGLPVGERLRSLLAPEGRAALKKALLPLALLALAAGRASAADFPPQNLLDQLKARLTESPSCAPNCAESPRLELKAAGDWLTMRFTVHAAAPAAVPIPTGGRDWTPARGTLDGAPLNARRDGDGSLWTPVPAGAHELVLEGPLPQADAVQLALPLKPRRVDASLSGWNLHGLRENGRPEDALSLSRARGAEAAPAAAATARAQGTFPPFLRVERTVRLGLTWTVTTRVVRLTPLGSAVSTAVPLLPGESITSGDVRATDGKAQVSLPPQSPSLEWSSVLPETKTLALTAATGKPWTESWRVEPGPLWHLSAKGLPPTFEEGGSGPRDLEYRPWPGETLTLDITRPGSVVGQTLTIDQSVLRLTPGVRATDAALSVRLRTSRGDRQTFVLPEGAELLAARVDGTQQPLRLEGRKLAVAVPPGTHQVEAEWRQPGGVKAFLRAPEVGLGAPAVNAHVEIAVPQGRWILLVGGRGVGPVVLFWSMLAVFALAALGLAKAGNTPLDWRRWLLLAVGLSQLSPLGAALVAGWFLAMAERGRRAPENRNSFNLVQAALAVYTLFAATLLFKAIAQGLLGAPDMQIAGNGSSASLLRWYLDRAGERTPRPWTLSVPLGAYRVAMLLWALWLADSVLDWARWAWSKYSEGGLWRKG